MGLAIKLYEDKTILITGEPKSVYSNSMIPNTNGTWTNAGTSSYQTIGITPNITTATANQSIRLQLHVPADAVRIVGLYWHYTPFIANTGGTLTWTSQARSFNQQNPATSAAGTLVKNTFAYGPIVGFNMHEDITSTLVPAYRNNRQLFANSVITVQAVFSGMVNINDKNFGVLLVYR